MISFSFILIFGITFIYSELIPLVPLAVLDLLLIIKVAKLALTCSNKIKDLLAYLVFLSFCLAIINIFFALLNLFIFYFKVYISKD